jgi:hypothetical protein
MPHRQDSKEDWMDVLGVILGNFERTRDLLGEGLGFNLGSKPLRSYRGVVNEVVPAATAPRYNPCKRSEFTP